MNNEILNQVEEEKSTNDLHQDEHDYDGIKELDNGVPYWITALFVITILISILYGIHYFWYGYGSNQDKEYVEMNEKYEKRFAEMRNADFTATLLTNETDLNAGAAIFKTMNCGACHGMNGEGNAVGPNLTDTYWINGCKINEVHRLIKEGNISKGMSSFKSQLGNKQIEQVASFILVKLKNSNPANPKAQQGVLCQ